MDIQKIIDENNGATIKVIANLPYYITTPIIMNFLENRVPIHSMIFMIQKEVANRMSAKEGTKEYGSLTATVKYFCTPYLVANVPRNCFMPRPNVDSAVIKLTTLDVPPVTTNDEKLFFKVIKTAFLQRRKTFLNCIYNQDGFNFDKETISKILIESGLDVNIRGEKLCLEEFAKVTSVLQKYM